ncbi:Uncharacterized protein BP5553_00056 [Venustampulla echinocandica]|uniref:non-specific serine/threonine protein kinase n=1 Tax=Venustampulla echinocandica TaxID=2656787 RepID=A0A370TX32_9HELO|nr:Uncharacterized protein BP5553_00056 [Venustampulla echinocandica]RDL40077.1 Uncharacterized protein BP5553_00056 [Venustampulla echinocandica]
MPRRRPPRDGPVVNNLIIFAAAILFLPWLVDAQQQQRPLRQRHESPHESLEAEAVHTIGATKIPHPIETPLTSGRRKNTLSVNNEIEHQNRHINIKNDASAIATLAPADSAVAAPPARQSTTTRAGLSSPHIARSLEDWEVEDFVLLATVDGKLHARDRKTGKERWELSYERPMVETKYFRRNRSEIEEDYESIPIDDFLWIVEPSRDGSLYIYRPGGPNPGLVNTGLTMKKLVEEMSPYGNEDPPVMYTGEKRTDMITVDANTGKVIKYFGPKGALVGGEGNCANRNFPSEECTSATLTIGRTEYTVGIQARKDGHQIATLSFFEWTPNTYDQDLQRQYHATPDNKYIYTSHDGGVIGFDHDRSRADEPGRLFKHKFASPVVRVFDVARPWNTEKNDPELIILPQPMPPDHDDETAAQHRASSIFLNHTEDGSWYAMSGRTYPLAVQGTQQAQVAQQGWQQHRPSWDIMNELQLSEALVGLHSIEHARTEPLLTISAPLDKDQLDHTFNDNVPALMDEPTVLQRFQQIPGIAAHNLLEFVKNPVLIIFLIGLLLTNQRQVRTWVGRLSGDKRFTSLPEGPVREDTPESDQLPQAPEIPVPKVEEEPKPAPDATTEKEAPSPPREAPAPPQAVSEPDKSADKPVDKPAEKPAKKAHRGRRGGVKHKKGKAAAGDGSEPAQDRSQDGNPPKPQPTVEDAVRDAQKLGEQTKLEPDIHTISNDPSEVSGPIIRIGALEVNTEKLIGTGSNGTMVFEGNFDGRSVAVKRMLIQFFDIASQETKLLRESDDHPNVIRYFAQQQAAGFLYIALELCPASLADVVEKPHLHQDLARGGERDLPNVLYQITNGLQHLHNLRIVHRDLKPQNILVAMGKDGRPRVLVSDFGLCKKLEGEQSSFRATTAHAAGTSGWRAPELLLDDDAKEGPSMVDASTDGGSGSILVSSDIMPNRRATRAIDIFSLGLVFFYVLTKGSHPFDCGDRYMREVNIRKGKYDLGRLAMYGEYGLEADDLIGSMLSPEPKQRPNARAVMAHPFFWTPKKRLSFLCDVSDHFEKEKRDPPSPALEELERFAPRVVRGDFLKYLGKDFVDSMGKQRKYTGTRLLDLLRALRNKKNHYEDMSDKLKKEVGPLPDGIMPLPGLKTVIKRKLVQIAFPLDTSYNQLHAQLSKLDFRQTLGQQTAPDVGFMYGTYHGPQKYPANANTVLPAEKAQYSAIIDGILASSDLQTISAKQIRKGLAAQLDIDLSDKKSAVQDLILERFDRASNAHNIPVPTTETAPPPATNGYHSGVKSEAEPIPSGSASSRGISTPSAIKDEDSEVDVSPPKKKQKRAKPVDDAKLAAMLQAQENSRARPTRGGVNKKASVRKKAPKKKSEKKVKAEDDSDVELDSNGEVKEKVKKGGFHKQYHLSAPLADLVGEPTLSRPQVVKKIWEYIKGRDLQDPADKRQILCDEKMQLVFKQDKVHMFTMNKILGKQLYDVEEE